MHAGTRISLFDAVLARRGRDGFAFVNRCETQVRLSRQGGKPL
jgi:hypothetical protein